MEKWSKIRHRIIVEGVSKRTVLRETGLHWRTLERILAHPAPPEFGRKSWPKPKIGAYLERIRLILESDREIPSKKQRHTAKREHGQWHHVNPDMQRWRQRQGQIVERAGDEALAAGYDSWLVFDVDEQMLAQGVAT